MKQMLLAAALAATIAAPVVAQQPAASGGITWVRAYEVERGTLGATIESWNRRYAAGYDQLVQQGHIGSWGLAVPLTQTAEGADLVLFATARDWAHASRALAGLEAWETTRGNDDSIAVLTRNIESIEDSIITHLASGTRQAVTSPPDYLVVYDYRANPFVGNRPLQFFETVGGPALREMTSKAMIDNWGFSRVTVSHNSPVTHMLWYMTDDLAALDGFNTHTDSILAGMSPADRMQYMTAAKEIIDPSYASTTIYRVIRLSTPAAPAR